MVGSRISFQNKYSLQLEFLAKANLHVAQYNPGQVAQLLQAGVVLSPSTRAMVVSSTLFGLDCQGPRGRGAPQVERRRW